MDKWTYVKTSDFAYDLYIDGKRVGFAFYNRGSRVSAKEMELRVRMWVQKVNGYSLDYVSRNLTKDIHLYIHFD